MFAQELKHLHDQIDDTSSEVSTDVETAVTRKILRGSAIYGEYCALQRKIGTFEAKYADVLQRCRAVLNHKPLEFSSLRVGAGKQIRHLVIVPRESPEAMRVPPDWLPMPSTRKHLRFQPREVVALHAQEELHRQQKQQIVQRCWLRFLEHVDVNIYTRMVRALGILAEIDCLCALAMAGRLPNYVAPRFVDEAVRGEAPVLELRQARHPVIEQVLVNSAFISNDVKMGGMVNSGALYPPTCLVLTGPNMSGKSSMMRLCALHVVLAQIGALVPAESASLSVFDEIVAETASTGFDHTSRTPLEHQMASIAPLLRLQPPL